MRSASLYWRNFIVTSLSHNKNNKFIYYFCHTSIYKLTWFMVVSWTAPNNPFIIAVLYVLLCIIYFAQFNRRECLYFYRTDLISMWTANFFFFSTPSGLIVSGAIRNKRSSRDTTIFYRAKYSNCKVDKQLFLSFYATLRSFVFVISSNFCLNK